MKNQRIKACLIVLFSIPAVGCGRLGERVDESIESVGSELTGRTVQVERVRLGLARGMGEITGLTVANPPGYEADYALQMDVLRLNLGILSTLAGEPIVLQELVIDSPVVNFERNAQGGSNLQDLMENVRKKLDEDGDTPDELEEPDVEPAGDEETPADAPGEPIRIAVRKLVIEGVGFTALGADGTTRSGTLPTIKLVDVGGSTGKTPAELGSVVVVAMAREMFKDLVAQQLRDSGSGIDLTLEALDAEAILASLESTLGLSPEQLAGVRPVIEKQCADLKRAVKLAQDQGFVEFESLVKQFGAAADELLTAFADILDDEQVEQLVAQFQERTADAVQEIRDALVDELTRFLELEPGQLDELRPILRDQIGKRYALLGRYADAPDRSFEDFIDDYEALQRETREALSGLLKPAQLEALKQHQADLLEILKVVYFGVT